MRKIEKRVYVKEEYKKGESSQIWHFIRAGLSHTQMVIQETKLYKLTDRHKLFSLFSYYPTFLTVFEIIWFILSSTVRSKEDR